MGRKKKGPPSLDMFAAGACTDPPPPAAEPVAPAPPASLPRAKVPWGLRWREPTCLEVDFTGSSSRYAVVHEKSGEELVELNREEFLGFAAQIEGE